MTSILVEVSGSVGKQVIPTTTQCCVESVIITPSAAVGTVKIRDGNASGEVVFYGMAPNAGGTIQCNIDHKFTKGLHVKVIGANAQAYLIIN